MTLKLVKASVQYQKEIIEMLIEWTSYNQNHHANISPGAIFRNNYEPFDDYISHLEMKKDNELGYVEDSVWFCYDEQRQIMVGAINIRHQLDEYLLNYGVILAMVFALVKEKKGMQQR